MGVSSILTSSVLSGCAMSMSPWYTCILPASNHTTSTTVSLLVTQVWKYILLLEPMLVLLLVPRECMYTRCIPRSTSIYIGTMECRIQYLCRVGLWI